MREELLEFEKKLLELRLEMAELLKRVENDNNADNKVKLRQLEEELGYVIRQYRALEAKLNAVSQPVDVQQQYAEKQSVQVQSQYVEKQQVQPAYTQPVAPDHKKNMENAIGTSLMGILASGLIFISIILFATLCLPYLSDFFKMVTCYVVSIAIITVSMYKLNKHPDSKFYLSLSGCGVGALYISLLLTNIYFEYINDITLFIGITIWVFFMCALSKIKHTIFAVIGHVGILIAVIFGTLLCMDEGDLAKFIMLTVFFVASTGTLYGVHFKKQIVKNILPNVFAIISLLILMIGAGAIIDGFYHGYFICIMIVILAFLGVVVYCDWNGSQLGYGLIPTAYVILLLLASGSFFEEDVHVGIFAYVISMVMIFIAEYKERSDDFGRYFMQLFMMICAWVGLASLDSMFEYLQLPMLAVPFMFIGNRQENSLCRYAAMFAVFTFLVNDMEMMPKFIFALIAMIALYVLRFIEEKSLGYKIVLHLISLVFILGPLFDLIDENIADYETSEALLYIIISVFNMIMFRVDYVKGETTTLYNIINAIMMVIGLDFIADNTPLHLLVIMVVIGAFLINAKRFLDSERLVPGIYVGIKFTILLIVILSSFETENYIISIMLILMSIACIIIGFAFKYKALRVYGLALSMISIFKLVMVDIHYDNTLGNALSFFISGVLCFAISMIYNYIGKKMEDMDQ